jgi:hypothetical protein
MGRPPNHELLRFVEKGLTIQLAHHEIVKQCQARFGISQRHSYRSIEKVYAIMEKNAEREKPMRKHQMRQTLRMIAQAALERKDFRAAIAALDRVARIDGLYEDMKFSLHHQGSVGVGIGLAALGFKSPQEVRGRIEELKERLASGESLAAAYLPEGSKGNGRGNGRDAIIDVPSGGTGGNGSGGNGANQ